MGDVPGCPCYTEFTRRTRKVAPEDIRGLARWAGYTFIFPDCVSCPAGTLLRRSRARSALARGWGRSWGTEAC